jgi:uncharacterized DUF497 family protein
MYSVHHGGWYFVWDEEKARTNRRKHGISFEEAMAVFDDPHARGIYDSDHSEDEDRFILLGLSSGARVLVVCHCYREDGNAIRIISARKANGQETKTYQRQI